MEMTGEKLYCGRAKRDITPVPEEWKHLRGLRNVPFGGVLDPIFLRVLLLAGGREQPLRSGVLFLVYELDKAPYPMEYLDLLSEETGLPRENIFFLAAHIHTAPICGDRTDDGPNNIAGKPEDVVRTVHSYEARLKEITLEAVREAMADLRPAAAGTGVGESSINVNRNQWYTIRMPDGSVRKKCSLGRNVKAPVDRKLMILRLEDEAGKVLALLINYPVHCSVLHGNTAADGKLGISGDLAGAVCRQMEQEYPGAVVLWTSGAAGDINPQLQVEQFYPDPVTGEPVCEMLPGDMTGLLRVMAGNHLRDIRALTEKIACREKHLQTAAATRMVRTPGNEGDYEVRLHMVRINQMLILSASGELYSSYAAAARKVLNAPGVIVMNHDASLCVNSGYIFDDDTLLLPDLDVPGSGHTNMKPGSFRNAFICAIREMEQAL